MSNKTAENSESSDAVDQDDVSSDKDPSAKARKMKLRRKRRKSSSGRVPPALTASAGSDKDKKDTGDGAKAEAREKDREKAKKRKKLRDKRDEGRSRTKESRSEDEEPKEKAKSKSEASEKSDSAERRKRREAKKKESTKSESRKRDKSKKSSTGDSDDSSSKESSAPKETDEKKDSQKEKEDRSAEKEAKRAERLEAKAERRKERLEKRKSKQEKNEDDDKEAKKEAKKESKKDEKVEAGKDLQLDSADLKKTPIEESKSSKGSRKSMRLKAKAKRKRRKKKRADMTASEAALVSDVSGIEEVSAIEEISAIEEVESSGKSKKSEKKRSKAKKSKPAAPLGERISPDSDELNCEEFHEIDDEKMAIKGLKITLDRPAIAKKDAEKLRAKKAKDKPKKAKSEIEEVEEIEEVDEIEEVSSKGSKSKKKDEDDAVVIEDIEEIEEIEEVATKGSKSKKDSAKKAKKAKKADEISEIEEIDDIEEVSAKSTKKKSKTGKASKIKAKPDKKTVKAGDTFELEDNEVEEVAAKPKKIERKFDKSKSGEKKGAGLKSGIKKGADKKGAGGKKRAGLGDRSRSRDRDREEAPVQKTSNFVPILAFGGILGVLIIALIYVASDDTGSNKPNRGAERQAALKLTVKEAIAYAESKSSERYEEVMERLKVLQKVTDKELKTKIDKKIKALQKAHLDEAQEKYDLLAMKALEQIDKGEVDRAIKTIDSFPAQYRDTNIWVNEAIPFINKALKSSSADSEGEPLLKAAERLRQAKKPARALGMLAGFSKDHAQTPMGAKIRELREAIRADVVKEQRKIDAQREREAIKARAAARASAAEEQVQKIRDLASNDDYPWIRQTGKNLFTWQIRQDYDKNSRIFSLSGRTITMKNTTGRAQILAKNKNDWKVFIVKFKVRLKTGRWSFLGKCLRAYNGRQQAHFMDRLTPQQSRNEWLDITIYVLEDGYYQVINNGDLEAMTPDEGDGRSVGGFGFWVASGTQVEFKDIEAKVIERGRLK